MTDIHDATEQIQAEFARQLAKLTGNPESKLATLESMRHHFLGKKGTIQALFSQLGQVEAQERRSIGQLLNSLREELGEQLEQAVAICQQERLEIKIQSESIDVTAPSPLCDSVGSIHPSMALLHRMVDILSSIGFKVLTSPNVDTDLHNFTDLNFADDHPARDMQDTFYLSNEWLLRTHTSNGQILAMKGATPPIRVAIPGRCFRNETVTARSHVMFHQLEALYIDEGVSMGDLLGTLEFFFQSLFGAEMRLRLSYFPFVEPGVEVDITCLICEGKGCSICKKTGWLEVAGAGMVHPNVLRSGGIDPERYSGFAWGIGVERLVMLMEGIEDIRLFTQGREDFLRQFATP